MKTYQWDITFSIVAVTLETPATPENMPARNVRTVGLICANHMRKPVASAVMSFARPVCPSIEPNIRSLPHPVKARAGGESLHRKPAESLSNLVYHAKSEFP